MNKYSLFFAVCTIIFALACSSSKNQDDKIEKYKVLQPLLTDTVYKTEYVAEIHSIQNVEIRARIEGFVEYIGADEGQFVKKGQILFKLNGTAYQQEVKKSKANTKSVTAELKSAEIELVNMEKLFDKKIIGKPELDLAAAKVDALKAKVDEALSIESQASLNLSFTDIRAPFDGYINRIPYKVGSLIEKNSLLTTISNNNEMFVYFKLSELDYLNYLQSTENKKAREVSLLLANNSEYRYKGKIETLETEFDRSSGNISFRARFKNPDQLLKHGASGKIVIETKLMNALIVPQKSTVEIQGNIYVFIVDNNNQVSMRKIIPSYSMPHFFVIESGLTPTDKFIYEGIQKVKDGDKVEVENISFSQIKDALNQ
ncbi:MAG: efflux RND transporter periplasmic adaptor subunit [Chitinophagaceae bacterium]